ncbi:MAG TPA: hypothetical protein VEA69_06300 [Tepidisphaeraceae bacterium]|nr:hypothetical protein [Tepidisphaeraceae bacterium]
MPLLRRAARWALGLATLLCALACLAVCALWVRSYVRTDGVAGVAGVAREVARAAPRPDGRVAVDRAETSWMAYALRGRLGATWRRVGDTVDRPAAEWGAHDARPRPPPPAAREFFSHPARGVDPADFGEISRETWHGWGPVRWAYSDGPHGPLLPATRLTTGQISVACWLLAPLLAAPPVIRLWRRPARRRRERRAAGLCPNCAYDVRATPGRCPECGWTKEGGG